VTRSAALSSAASGFARTELSEPVHDPDADVDPETDAEATDAPTTYRDLLIREFGAEIVEEIPTE